MVSLFDMPTLWLEGDADLPPTESEYLNALSNLRRLYGSKVFTLRIDELGLPSRRDALDNKPQRLHPTLIPLSKLQWAPVLSVIYRRDGGRRLHLDTVQPDLPWQLSAAPRNQLDHILIDGTDPAADMAQLNTWALWCLSELPRCRRRTLQMIRTLNSATWLNAFTTWRPDQGHRSARDVVMELLTPIPAGLDEAHTRTLVNALPDTPVWLLTAADVPSDPYWSDVVAHLWCFFGVYLPTVPHVRMWAVNLPTAAVWVPHAVRLGLRWLLRGRDSTSSDVYDGLANLRVSHLPREAFGAVPDVASWARRRPKNPTFENRMDVAPQEIMQALCAWRAWLRARGVAARVVNPDHICVMNIHPDPLVDLTQAELACAVQQALEAFDG